MSPTGEVIRKLCVRNVGCSCIRLVAFRVPAHLAHVVLIHADGLSATVMDASVGSIAFGVAFAVAALAAVVTPIGMASPYVDLIAVIVVVASAGRTRTSDGEVLFTRDLI